MMKWDLVRCGLATALLVSSIANFASSEKIVYGLEKARHFNSSLNTHFYIQLASFATQANAYRYQHSVQTKTSRPVKIRRSGDYYVVFIGPLFSAADLRNTANALIENKAPIQPISMHPPLQKLKQDNYRSTQPLSNRVSNSNWFIALGTGAGFPIKKDTLYVNNGSGFAPPNNIDIYSLTQKVSPLINVSAGARWQRNDSWLTAYSLGLFYQHSFLGNWNGAIIQNSIPTMNNYNYQWQWSSDIVLASAKINWYTHNPFSLYVSSGVGVAINQSRYNEMALPGVTARVSPNFSGTSPQFAYNVGAGVDVQVRNDLIFNVGYLYQNLGDMIGRGQGTWQGTSLVYNSAGINEVTIGVTYLFGQ